MRTSLHVSIDLDSGDDCAECEIEIELEVSYTSTPAERATLEHPGCPAEIEIYDVTVAHAVTALGGAVTLYRKGQPYVLSDAQAAAIRESIERGDDYAGP